MKEILLHLNRQKSNNKLVEIMLNFHDLLIGYNVCCFKVKDKALLHRKYN